MMKTPASVTTIGAGATTASLGTELPVVKEAIPFLEVPIAYFEIGGSTVVLPVGNLVVLLVSTFTVIGVITSIVRRKS